MNNPFHLQGKTILVVGASSGIGRSIAVECSRMGAQLVLSARSREGLEETYALLRGEGHQIICADITSEQDCENLISRATALDGLVMSAGVSLILPMPFCTREKYSRIYEVNYFSQVELIRLLVKKKKLGTGASIVVVSSAGGSRIITAGNSVYGSAKAALESYSKYAALEYAPRGIRVNTLCPAMVKTPLMESTSLSENDMKQDEAKYPLKRYGRPEDVAYAAIYLLSDASSWVTGLSMVLDGGVSL